MQRTSLLNVCVVLVEPSHPGNVGAVARAMRVMGLGELRLVSADGPFLLGHAQARAFAAGADEVLEAARVFESLAAALADRRLCVAISAAPRAFGPPPLTPEDMACQVLDEATATALVFGPERTGLSIEHVALCQRLCSIPTDDEHSSLNLAQAVQVITYVLRREWGRRALPLEASAASDSSSLPPSVSALVSSEVSTQVTSQVMSPPNGPFADHADLEGFYGHLERSLVAVGYLDPRHPKKLMPRMRRLFSRARLESEEIHLLRGVFKLMEQAAERASKPR